MRLAIYFIKYLKIVCDTDFDCPSVVQQAVVIAFAASDAVAATVISDCGHHYHVYVVNVSEVIAVRFLDVERA